MVIGGYAVGFHGHPRLTQTLDIWISREPDNAEAMVKALESYDLYMFKESFEIPNNVVQLGEPPDRIDILTSVNNVMFNEAYPRREALPLDGLEVTLIDFENLIKTKTGTGRARDVSDVEDLQRQRD